LFIGDSKVGPEKIEVPSLTTPDAPSFRRILDFLADEKVTHFAFEASSHGLVQRRAHDIALSAAAFTNFGSDHLDYHKTRGAYFESKLILFKEILRGEGAVVILGDQPEIREGVSKYNKNIMTFGFNAGNLIRAENVRGAPDGVSFDLTMDGKVAKDISVALFGEFQILNILCAASLAYACGLPSEGIIETIPKIRALNGRMEKVATCNGGHVYVDYAHTADGFRRTLEAFRKPCHKRLICVFGCGGDRDKSKRRLMGEAAGEIADVVIVTDDNPRSEDPAVIRREILTGCPGSLEVGDRKEAIKYAMNLLGPGDFVIIQGKGHETTQTYGDKIISHNDREEALRHIVKLEVS
jgi:UDP-N-acetylmuramoyl-L-alanyl-D-glutamate--2,6-diaminopimelate ligase